MFKCLFITLSFVLTALCSSAVVAQATPSVAAAAAAASTEDAKAAAVKKLFAERFNNPPIAGVRLTPYGLYEVQLGSDLVYTDEKVNFVLDGTLIDAKTRRDITRERQDELAKMPFDQLPFELAFKQVRGDGSRKLAIFEDPNCGYCKTLRKSLGEIDNLTVYTFPYPILSPDSTQKVKNIWCAKDRAETWDAWMLKGVVPPTINCNVPVDKMVALGQKLMVRGTPAIFFADGSRVGGAIPKDELEKRLKQ
jgi:thiol:disulfide interchange protein DsbC